MSQAPACPCFMKLLVYLGAPLSSLSEPAIRSHSEVEASSFSKDLSELASCPELGCPGLVLFGLMPPRIELDTPPTHKPPDPPRKDQSRPGKGLSGFIGA